MYILKNGAYTTCMKKQNLRIKNHILVRLGRERFNHPKSNLIHLVDDPEANAFLSNLNEYPHAYVLACCMDRQTKAERAWMIPAKIMDLLGSFDMGTLASKSLEEYITLFVNNNLHRFNETMAEVFYNAVQRIHTEYHDNAAEIWSGCPSSATVVYRFLQFNGVGVKIATMAANILARQFRIPFSDFYSIDVSPDVHVKRVLYRMDLVENNADNDKIIYKARELCPEFPGIIDYSLWEIGRKWCRPTMPDCEHCIVKSECPKHIR